MNEFEHIKVIRCQHCGRFVERGIFNYSNHVINHCPSKNSGYAKQLYRAAKGATSFEPFIIPLNT